jgi:hypothetical protein
MRVVFIHVIRGNFGGVQIHATEILDDVVIAAVGFVEGHGRVIGFRRGDLRGMSWRGNSVKSFRRFG